MAEKQLSRAGFIVVDKKKNRKFHLKGKALKFAIARRY